MHIQDFLFCIVISFVSSYFLSIGWYPQALFSAFLFLTVVISIFIHNVNQTLLMPLPRVSLKISDLTNETPEES